MGANLIRVPEIANKFWLAGETLPGVATVSGCVAQNKLDVQAGSGTKGATVVYKGSEPQEFTVDLHLCTEEEYDEWLEGNGRRILLTPPTGAKAQAFDVYHPACDEAGITSALRKSVAAAEHDGLGGYHVKIVLMPYVPPQPSHGTPKGSATQWEKAKPGDAADATISDLVNQAQNL